jgi:hypothetical protein
MTDKENKIPKWLKKIQEHSWELEILISGGAIFSLYQLSDVFLDFSYTIEITSGFQTTTPYILFLCLFMIELLKIGFTSHLLIRAYWVSQISINLAFPNGIIDRRKLIRNSPFKIKNYSNDILRNDLLKID